MTDSVPPDELRSVPELQYTLGELHADLDDLHTEGELSDDFTIYNSFDDSHICEKPYLRRLALLQGRIDALTYLTDGTEPPIDADWVSSDGDRVCRNVESELVTACTERGGVGTTWTSYLRGWMEATHYALGRTATPSTHVHPDDTVPTA